MYRIINKNVYVNRGDALTLHLVNRTGDFKAGDWIILSICEENNLENTLLTKRIDISEASDVADISVTSAETKSLCEAFKTGYKIFWYEIELNNNTTLIGYDLDGPKLFVLYPEASKISEGSI